MLTTLAPEAILCLVGCFVTLVISVYLFMTVSDLKDRDVDRKDEITALVKKTTENVTQIKDVPSHIEQLTNALQRNNNAYAAIKDELAELRVLREEDQDKIYQYTEQLDGLFTDKELPVLSFEEVSSRSHRRSRSAPPSNKRQQRPASYKSKPASYSYSSRRDESDTDEDAHQQLARLRRNRDLERQMH
jgi:septal ring factor EnvC (AmiA/AmiB activator)